MSDNQAGAEPYEERFGTFLKNTNQKILTGRIFRQLLETLHISTNMMQANPFTMVDVGCGEGTLSRELLKILRPICQQQIKCVGLDRNRLLLDKFKKSLFGFAKVVSSTIQDDAFGFHPFGGSWHLVVASHVIYHAHDSNDPFRSASRAERFITNVVNSLETNAIAIMVHESKHSDMRELGTRYGSPLMSDAPEVIQSTCRKYNITMQSIPFEAELRFPNLTKRQWGMFEQPKLISIAKQIPELNEALRLLGFTVQRPMNEMDNQELQGLTRDIQERLDENSALCVRSDMQVLISPERGPWFEKAVQEACDKVRAVVPELQRETSLVAGKLLRSV